MAFPQAAFRQHWMDIALILKAMLPQEVAAAQADLQQRQQALAADEARAANALAAAQRRLQVRQMKSRRDAGQPPR